MNKWVLLGAITTIVLGLVGCKKSNREFLPKDFARIEMGMTYQEVQKIRPFIKTEETGKALEKLDESGLKAFRMYFNYKSEDIGAIYAKYLFGNNHLNKIEFKIVSDATTPDEFSTLYRFLRDSYAKKFDAPQMGWCWRKKDLYICLKEKRENKVHTFLTLRKGKIKKERIKEGKYQNLAKLLPGEFGKLGIGMEIYDLKNTRPEIKSNEANGVIFYSEELSQEEMNDILHFFDLPKGQQAKVEYFIQKEGIVSRIWFEFNVPGSYDEFRKAINKKYAEFFKRPDKLKVSISATGLPMDDSPKVLSFSN